MSVNTEIDQKRNLVIHYFNESVNLETLTQTITNTKNNPDYQIGMNAIWLCEEGTKVDMSSEDAKLLSNYARKSFDENGKKYKLALVASDDFAYGMSRVYEGWSNDRPITINTFRKLDDALNWIEIESE